MPVHFRGFSPWSFGPSEARWSQGVKVENRGAQLTAAGQQSVHKRLGNKYTLRKKTPQWVGSPEMFPWSFSGTPANTKLLP